MRAKDVLKLLRTIFFFLKLGVHQNLICQINAYRLITRCDCGPLGGGGGQLQCDKAKMF